MLSRFPLYPVRAGALLIVIIIPVTFQNTYPVKSFSANKASVKFVVRMSLHVTSSCGVVQEPAKLKESLFLAVPLYYNVNI